MPSWAPLNLLCEQTYLLLIVPLHLTIFERGGRLNPLGLESHVIFTSAARIKRAEAAEPRTVEAQRPLNSKMPDTNYEGGFGLTPSNSTLSP
eukprot:scaffold7488_cov37-Tisochrysis_lutea.AAC.3